MKLKLIIFGICIILLIVIMGCSQNQQYNIQDNNQTKTIPSLSNTSFLTYAHKDFKIDYPNNWELFEGYDGVDVMFKSSNANLNVIKMEEDLSGYASRDVANDISEFYQTQLLNYTLIDMKPVSISGLDAYQIVYTNANMGYLFKKFQVFIVQNSTGFIITYTAGGKDLSINESTNDFEENLEIANRMVESFKII